MSEIGCEFETPFEDIASKFVFREFMCPATGYIIDTEVALGTQPAIHDIRIEPGRPPTGHAA
jgi:acetone carboxylase gamma subunit